MNNIDLTKIYTISKASSLAKGEYCNNSTATATATASATGNANVGFKKEIIAYTNNIACDISNQHAISLLDSHDLTNVQVNSQVENKSCIPINNVIDAILQVFGTTCANVLYNYIISIIQ